MKKMKKERKMKKSDSLAKSSTISRVTVVVVTFFVKIFDDFHDFVSECVSFPKKINNPRKIAKVSPSNNNYSFRII